MLVLQLKRSAYWPAFKLKRSSLLSQHENPSPSHPVQVILTSQTSESATGPWIGRRRLSDQPDFELYALLTPPTGLIVDNYKFPSTFVVNCIALDCRSEVCGHSDESL